MDAPLGRAVGDADSRSRRGAGGHRARRGSRHRRSRPAQCAARRPSCSSSEPSSAPPRRAPAWTRRSARARRRSTPGAGSPRRAATRASSTRASTRSSAPRWWCRCRPRAAAWWPRRARSRSASPRCASAPAGRASRTGVDPAVGIILAAKPGDHVETGAPLAHVHARSAAAAAAAAGRRRRGVRDRGRRAAAPADRDRDDRLRQAPGYASRRGDHHRSERGRRRVVRRVAHGRRRGPLPAAHVRQPRLRLAHAATRRASSRRRGSAALAHGLAIGAHPGLPDLVGFGRRALAVTPGQAYADVVYQVGALAGVLATLGGALPPREAPTVPRVSRRT